VCSDHSALPGSQELPDGAKHQAAIDADRSARLEAYNGQSIADFQARTGMLPMSAYPVSEGRVFVYRTNPVYLTLPATNVTLAVTRTVQCQVLIWAVNRSQVSGADRWVMRGTERSGTCNKLPV